MIVLRSGIPIAPIGVNCSSMYGPFVGQLGGVFGPDQLRHQAAQVGHRQLADVEQRAEEGEEEHHLGKDEPAHAPAERRVHLLVVMVRLGFADHRAEPAEQHHEQHGEPGRDQPGSRRDGIHPERRAHAEEEQRDGADERPIRGLRYEVIRLPAGVYCAHRGYALSGEPGYRVCSDLVKICRHLRPRKMCRTA